MVTARGQILPRAPLSIRRGWWGWASCLFVMWTVWGPASFLPPGALFTTCAKPSLLKPPDLMLVTLVMNKSEAWFYMGSCYSPKKIPPKLPVVFQYTQDSSDFAGRYCVENEWCIFLCSCMMMVNQSGCIELTIIDPHHHIGVILVLHSAYRIPLNRTSLDITSVFYCAHTTSWQATWERKRL